LQRSALSALIAAEFASRFADAMNADEQERDAIIARLEQEQAARLEEAMTQMAAEATQERKATVGSLLQRHRDRSRALRKSVRSSPRSGSDLQAAFAKAKALCTRMQRGASRSFQPHLWMPKPG
jgi:hypothetical protein